MSGPVSEGGEQGREREQGSGWQRTGRDTIFTHTIYNHLRTFIRTCVVHACSIHVYIVAVHSR